MEVGPFQLRPHQISAVGDARKAIRDGAKRIIIRAPTGAGKTIVSSKIVELALDRGSRVLFLASGRQLIYQKSSKLAACSIPHGILMAGEEYISGHQCIVSSKDTLWSRAFKNGRLAIPSPDVLIVDEAHLASAGDSWQQIYEAFPNAIIIGFTATPAMGNGKALPGWDAIVDGGTYEELIRNGYLVPAKVFAPFAVDMSGVDINRSNGEYVLDQMAQRFDDNVLVGDFIKEWLRYGEDRLTAFFAASVRASIKVAEMFTAAGIPALHMDADTPQDEREDAFRLARSGDVKVLCNFGVLRVGVDIPEIECIQLGVAMNSLNSYLQTVGRGLRAHTFLDGRVKQDVIIIDHGGCVHKHGWPTEDHDWSITDESTVQERDSQKATAEKKQREPLCCPECGAMRESGPVCLNCGHKHKRTGLKVRTVSGELKPLERKTLKKVRERSTDEKTWLTCMSIAANTGMTVNQARVLFNQKQNKWPGDEIRPMPPRHQWGVKVRELYPKWGRKKS